MSSRSFTGQLAKLALPVAVIVGVVFVTGQRAQSERTRRLTVEAEDVWRLVDDGLAHSEGRPAATAEERERWARIDAAFDAAVAPGVRLPFSREIARLATRTGVSDFRLVEMERDEVVGPARLVSTTPGAEEPFDALDETEYADPGSAIDVVEVVPHAYVLTFVATFDGLVRFAEGLGRMSRLVEVESVSVERQLPGLAVQMRVATYGRAS